MKLVGKLEKLNFVKKAISIKKKAFAITNKVINNSNVKASEIKNKKSRSRLEKAFLWN